LAAVDKKLKKVLTLRSENDPAKNGVTENRIWI